MNSTDVVLQDDLENAVAAATTLFGTADPALVVERASSVARTLADVVRKQNLIVRIGQSEHVRVEGWTFLGSLLGVFPVVEWTRPVMDGDTKAGWEARVEARTRSGEVVGAAEAECLRAEKEWGPNPTKGRPKDDYALRSMAQTRAVSKAMRLPLGFVMQLAGFSPTPAEEMPAPGTVAHPEGELVDDGKFPPEGETAPVTVISDAQRTRLFAIAGEHKVPEEVLRALVKDICGVESTKQIPAVRYDALCEAVERAGQTQFKIPEGAA